MEHQIFLNILACFLVSDRMPLSEGKEVVIVGGGVSGLAAASHLCRNGICNITILEAGDRIGGRLRSDQFQGVLIQRGAQFIHGESNNPVYDMLSESFNLKKPIYFDPAELSFFRVSGQRIDHESIMKYFVAMDDVSTHLVQNLTEEKDVYKNIENETTQEWSNEVQSNLIGIDRNVTDAMLDHFLSFQAIVHGELSRRVGMLTNLYYEDLGNNYLVEGDYADALIGILKKDIPDSAIRLQQRVIRIDWNTTTSDQHYCVFEGGESNIQDAKVRVLYNDVNTGEMRQACVDHVIVTVSVGVLQKHHATMFNPKFTDEKSRALQSLRIGVANKVFLRFNQPFWKYKAMHILWDSDLNAELGYNALWLSHIQLIEEYEHRTLLTWLNSYATQAASQLTDDEIGQQLTVLLRKVLLNDSIPLPDDVLVTAWHEDENFLGSYSYIPVGETLESKIVAAAPLNVGGVPKVLFAGEAMHHSRFSTVDGAYRTGIDEANRILSDSGRSSRSNPIISIFLCLCVYLVIERLDVAYTGA